jgi:hypothetical protein
VLQVEYKDSPGSVITAGQDIQLAEFKRRHEWGLGCYMKLGPGISVHSYAC